jgi:hypothetical protein
MSDAEEDRSFWESSLVAPPVDRNQLKAKRPALFIEDATERSKPQGHAQILLMTVLTVLASIA